MRRPYGRSVGLKLIALLSRLVTSPYGPIAPFVLWFTIMAFLPLRLPVALIGSMVVGSLIFIMHSAGERLRQRQVIRVFFVSYGFVVPPSQYGGGHLYVTTDYQGLTVEKWISVLEQVLQDCKTPGFHIYVVQELLDTEGGTQRLLIKPKRLTEGRVNFV